MRPNFIGKRKPSHSGPTVVLGRHALVRFVRIGTQKIENATPQFGRISLQIIKEIDAKPLRMNITFPSGDDRARVRTQEQSSSQQISINFVDVGYIERFDLMVLNFLDQ